MSHAWRLARNRALLAALTVSPLMLTACGDEVGDGAGRGEPLTVSAASSLTGAFEDYGETFPGEERFSFAGSDELAAQIRQGAKPDVYASASTTLPDQLFEEGLVEPPIVFARNRLVVAVPAKPDLPLDETPVQDFADLAEPGPDLVIGAEGVPVGDYTREVLEQIPAAERKAILANVRSEEPEVKGIVGKIATGAADAGFVYASDVDAAEDELEDISLRPGLESDIAYAAAVVDGAAEPERAQAFVDGLLAGEGALALADADFLPPPG